MKRIIALCVVALMAAALATTADAGRFGIKGGVNVNSLDFNGGNTPGALGYSAGLTWQWDLPLWLSLQPELMYHVKATSLAGVEDQLGFGYVEVPVNIQWGPRLANRNVRIFAQATPFVGYAVAQTGNTSSVLDEYRDAINLAGQLGMDVSGLENLDKASAAVNQWTDINRWSYGCGLGVGVQLWALQVTAQYLWNFGQLSKDVELSKELFSDSNFGGYNITVALMFGGKKKNK